MASSQEKSRKRCLLFYIKLFDIKIYKFYLLPLTKGLGDEPRENGMKIEKKFEDMDEVNEAWTGLTDEAGDDSEFRSRDDESEDSWGDLDVDFFREEDSDGDEDEFDMACDLDDESDWSWKP